MKHYVQNRQARKQEEWKETAPLKLVTYFAATKQKVEGSHLVSTFRPTTVHKKVGVVLPSKEKLPLFIKHYHPRSK